MNLPVVYSVNNWPAMANMAKRPFFNSLNCTFSHVSGSDGFNPNGSNPRSPGAAPSLTWLNCPRASTANIANIIWAAANGLSLNTWVKAWNGLSPYKTKYH